MLWEMCIAKRYWRKTTKFQKKGEGENIRRNYFERSDVIMWNVNIVISSSYEYDLYDNKYKIIINISRINLFLKLLLNIWHAYNGSLSLDCFLSFTFKYLYKSHTIESKHLNSIVLIFLSLKISTEIGIAIDKHDKQCARCDTDFRSFINIIQYVKNDLSIISPIISFSFFVILKKKFLFNENLTVTFYWLKLNSFMLNLDLISRSH